MPFRLSPHPHSRLWAICRQCRGGSPKKLARGWLRVTGSATGGECRAGELLVPSPRQATVDERWTLQADRCAERMRWPGLPRCVPRGGFSRRFATTSQIHFRSHANICTHFISLLDGHFKTFWSLMNHFWTDQGPCRANLHKRGLTQSPSCDCGQ